MKKKWFGSLLASTALVAALASSQAFAATNDGWIQSGNQWNLYQEGKLVKDGWAKDKGTWYFFDNNGNIFRLTDANFLYKYGVLINIYSDILEFCGKINTNSDNTLL